MSAQATEKLQEIFRAVFELPEGADLTRLRQMNTQEWDSLAHVSLVVAIESEFGMSLDAAEQLQMTSYQATQLLLEEKGL
jgi:acyl carrier protein